MALPTLDDLKRHMKIRHDQENADLQEKLDAAIEYASQFLGRDLPWKDDAGDEVAVPASVRAAILLLAAEFYANREQGLVGVSYVQMPTVENLLHFHRKGLGV